MNVLPLDMYAIMQLHNSGVRFVSYDQKAGRCLISAEDYGAVQHRILSGPAYLPCGDAQGLVPHIINGYRRLCQDVGRFTESSHTTSDLTRSIGTAGGSRDSRLIFTLKSHKTPLEFRNIHANPQSAFSSLSWWVTSVLENKLRDLTHIIQSNEFFSQGCPQDVPWPDLHFLRLDVKSFLMSGNPESLANDASEILSDSPPLAALAHRVILWLLENQYVESDEPDPIVCQVIIGSGMGLAHSLAIANAAFHTRAERWFTTTATRKQSPSNTTVGIVMICSSNMIVLTCYFLL